MQSIRWMVGLSVYALLAVASIACRTPTGSATAAPEKVVAGLPSATPEEVGISAERLGRLTAAMEKFVDEGRVAGITTAVARHGKVASYAVFGQRDIEPVLPMAPNTIFRIYSMSKPITGVALMMLYKEGKFRLADPWPSTFQSSLTCRLPPARTDRGPRRRTIRSRFAS